MAESKPRCKNLVLDAGPLLSLSPLRGLAEIYLTVPQVLDELKDKRAREHFERLGLSAGVQVDVRNPDAASLAHVVQFAKKTGDYAVLSHADICVLALTHSLHVREQASSEKDPKRQVQSSSASHSDPSEDIHSEDDKSEEREPLDIEILPEGGEDIAEDTHHPSSDEARPSDQPLYEDPSDEDDGEGEWVTPQNVALHKSQALQLLPSDSNAKKKGRGRKQEDEFVPAGCMTGDFAVQNVLLQMGLTLVGTEGKRIQKVKSWVLRCHACFKICKDNSKQFCPSCGNPTLMRASVTVASPDASPDAPAMQVHLKKNFQYKVRGTKYSIPAPKPGSAKTGPGEGLILREDQLNYMRAKKRTDGKRDREERRMIKGLVDKGGEGGVSVGGWSDPDWMPGILSAGTGGQGRSSHTGGDMPQIGYGRKNPNERKKWK
ncbi:Nin one binding Zn-ribbon like-domain-containing protein [Suillus fuscotomentosus]|uniref:20S-pre-rRNA D-site endonuclease NOB1 n=1 Tax=Suillus fuscotomentosus TaxID=1912939 RepID=A0AAD4EIX2_9AGAM|nr:Nin one binding Zn-ribbon like-domain-containing protein [Suillus fuscotomentosus]KAG1906965.1 Nin one binding Zn-ribbon like-domain-containing protein [Suillus fuscotomentosus]